MTSYYWWGILRLIWLTWILVICCRSIWVFTIKSCCVSNRTSSLCLHIICCTTNLISYSHILASCSMWVHLFFVNKFHFLMTLCPNLVDCYIILNILLGSCLLVFFIVFHLSLLLFSWSHWHWRQMHRCSSLIGSSSWLHSSLLSHTVVRILYISFIKATFRWSDNLSNIYSSVHSITFSSIHDITIISLATWHCCYWIVSWTNNLRVTCFIGCCIILFRIWIRSVNKLLIYIVLVWGAALNLIHGRLFVRTSYDI